MNVNQRGSASVFLNVHYIYRCFTPLVGSILSGVLGVGDASVQRSTRCTARSYETGKYPPQTHLEVEIDRCTSSIVICEAKVSA